MNNTSPEVIKEVERVLERNSLGCSTGTSAGGIKSVVEILNRADWEPRNNSRPGGTGPGIGRRDQKLMFVFEDLVTLDDRSVQRILREVENQDWFWL